MYTTCYIYWALDNDIWTFVQYRVRDIRKSTNAGVQIEMLTTENNASCRLELTYGVQSYNLQQCSQIYEYISTVYGEGGRKVLNPGDQNFRQSVCDQIQRKKQLAKITLAGYLKNQRIMS